MHLSTAPRNSNAIGLGHLFIGGLVGLIIWEVFANTVTPIFVGGPLEPPALIISLFQNLFGIDPGKPAAVTLHYLTGIVFYPIGYYLVTRFIVSFGTVTDGILWGVITWILALGVFATLAGLPFMLGFIKLSWFSLIGHVIYGLIAVLVFTMLAQRRSPLRAAA